MNILPLSNDEIREKLGLLSEDDARLVGLLKLNKLVKENGREYAARHWQRGTGRTTNTIVRALEAIQMGTPVRFLAANRNIEQMMASKCFEYAEKLGFNTKLILNIGNHRPADGNLREFADHYNPELELIRDRLAAARRARQEAARAGR